MGPYALGFTLLQGILLTEDVVITCRQCQRPPLESVRCLRPSLQSQGTTTHTHTLAPVSVSAPRSKAKHVLVRQRLSPEARCQVAASCRQLQGRTGACRAPLRAVSRSVGASSLRRDVAEWWCTRERERTLVWIEDPRCDRQGGGTRTCSVAPCHCVET